MKERNVRHRNDMLDGNYVCLSHVHDYMQSVTTWGRNEKLDLFSSPVSLQLIVYPCSVVHPSAFTIKGKPHIGYNINFNFVSC